MRGRNAIVVLALSLSAAVAGDASAWGPDGHRVTGEIAWRLLSKRSKDAIQEILRAGDDGTLAEAAAWADTDARQDRRYRWVEPLHYVNVAPGARRVDAGRECKCVVGAIEQERDLLRDPNRSPGETPSTSATAIASAKTLL